MKPCKLPKGHIMLMDHSNHIVVITKDNKIYRYQLTVVNVNDSNTRINEKMNVIQSENYVHNLMTTEFVDNNKIPHIIRLYNVIHCEKIPPELFRRCNDYYELVKSNNTIEPFCIKYIQGYPNKIHDGMYIQDIEFYEYELPVIISKLKPLDSVFRVCELIIFQIAFTLKIIKLKYPEFYHGNLDIVNLGANVMEEPNYDRYYIEKMVFDIPRKKIVCKILDFNNALLNKKTTEKYEFGSKTFVDNHSDIFILITSMIDFLLRFYPKNINDISKHFNTFVDSKFIIEMVNKGDHMLLGKAPCYDVKFSKKIKMLSIDEILKYFNKKYPKNEKNKIIQHYNNTE